MRWVYVSRESMIGKIAITFEALEGVVKQARRDLEEDTNGRFSVLEEFVESEM